MGQRHQIFVVVANPAKFCHKEYKADLEKKFGKRDTTVLAYHNQWLYGRSALDNALNLLKFGAKFSVKDKTDENSHNFNAPFLPARMSLYGSDKLTDNLAFIMNFRPIDRPWLGAGIGGTFFIGDKDTELRDDFTRGDNNDGITIIDLINNKYCFMNIHDYERESGELCNDVNDLPRLQPVDAHAYVKAYYGETIETCNPYYLTKRGGDNIPLSIAKQNKVIAENIKINAKLVKGFSKFGVLTQDEIKLIFPKMKFGSLVK